MANNSSIEWTDATWNPVTGCSKVSPGCKYCYAERLSVRLAAMGNPRYRNGFRLSLQVDLLELPLKWRQPRRIFVNSMSDLFHDRVSDDFIRQVFDVMEQADWHRYQVLTKRPERVVALNDVLPWPPQVWLGVSVESADYTPRIYLLRQTDAAVKFLQFVTSDEAGSIWVDMVGELPARLKAGSDPELLADPKLGAFAAGLAYAQATFFVNESDQRQALIDAYDMVVLGGEDQNAALEIAAETVQGILDDHYGQ